MVNRETNINQYLIAKSDPKERVVYSSKKFNGFWLYIAFTWQTLQTEYQTAEGGKSLSEKDLKVGVDHKAQADIYQVNWQGILQAF